MKLFKHYNQEILHMMLMLMISFLIIMVSVSFVRYLALAADGEIPLKNVVGILGVLLPNFIMMLLPITLFLSIVIGLNRLLHDNELLIGFACGMSFSKLIRQLFRFTLPLAVVGALLSFFIVPKMNDYQDQLTEIASQNTSMINFVQSGRFFALGANQIIYVSNVNFTTRKSQDIFMYQNTGPTTQIVLAPAGAVESQGNTLAEVNLENGQEYEFSNAPNSLSARMMTFDKLVMTLIPNYNFDNNNDLSARTSASLWGVSTLDSSELEWRTTVPLAIIVLTILGAVLSDLSPRTSRIVKIFYAVTLFIIYFNLLSVMKSLIVAGRFPLFPGLFTVHLGFLLLALLLLGLREGWFNFLFWKPK